VLTSRYQVWVRHVQAELNLLMALDHSHGWRYSQRKQPPVAAELAAACLEGGVTRDQHDGRVLVDMLEGVLVDQQVSTGTSTSCLCHPGAGLKFRP